MKITAVVITQALSTNGYWWSKVSFLKIRFTYAAPKISPKFILIYYNYTYFQSDNSKNTPTPFGSLLLSRYNSVSLYCIIFGCDIVVNLSHKCLCAQRHMDERKTKFSLFENHNKTIRCHRRFLIFFFLAYRKQFNYRLIERRQMSNRPNDMSPYW